MSQCLQKKLPMTLGLCNGIIVFEATTMLHDIDAEFAVIDSALKAKKRASTQDCGVGVGIFSPTPTSCVQFLYILVILTEQFTRPRAAVQCGAVIFLREPCRVSRDTACNS